MNFVFPIKKKADIKAMKKYLKKNNLRDYTLFVFGINSALRVSDLLNLQLSDVTNEDGSIKERMSAKEQKTGKTKMFPFNESIQEILKGYLPSHNNKDSCLFPSRIWLTNDKGDYVNRTIIVNFLRPYISDIEEQIKEYKSINEIAISGNIKLNDYIQEFKSIVFAKIEQDVMKSRKIKDKEDRIEDLQADVLRDIKKVLNFKGHDPISRQYVHLFIKEAGASVGIKENISSHSMRKTFAANYYYSNIKTNPGAINTLQDMLNHKDSSTTLRYIGLTQDILDSAYMNNAL